MYIGYNEDEFKMINYLQLRLIEATPNGFAFTELLRRDVK